MLPNLKPSQRIAVLASIDPQSASTVKHSGWVDMTKLENILAVIKAGAMTATGTVDAKLEQATDGSGTGVKDVTGKAITQWAAGTNDNEQALLNCRAEDLDFANGFCFVRLTITPATAASLIDGTIYGLDAKYAPQAQAASVVQTA